MTDLLAHHCPQCRQSTRHMVFRERMLATVLWCRQCYHVSVQADAGAFSAVPERDDIRATADLI